MSEIKIFQISCPWFRRLPNGTGTYYKYRPELISVWHEDPGMTDQCNFSGYERTRQTGWPDVVWDSYKDLPADAQRAVDFMWWVFKDRLTARKWYQSPKLHFRHWKIRSALFRVIKTYLFSKCAVCGNRFNWKEANGCRIKVHGKGSAYISCYEGCHRHNKE